MANEQSSAQLGRNKAATNSYADPYRVSPEKADLEPKTGKYPNNTRSQNNQQPEPINKTNPEAPTTKETGKTANPGTQAGDKVSQTDRQSNKSERAAGRVGKSEPAKTGQEINPASTRPKNQIADQPKQTNQPLKRPQSRFRKKQKPKEKPKEKKERISFISAICLIVVAFMFDLLSFIPIIIAIIGWLVFLFWFWLLGVGFINPKRLAAPIGSFIIELIPAVSIIPSITLAVIITILMVKFEDKTGLKLPAPGNLAKPAK